MSYIQGTLSKDEEVKIIVKLHWANYIITCLYGAVALILVLAWLADGTTATGAIFFVCLTIWDFLKLKLKEMVVTNKRVVCRTGVISVSTEELKNQKIESVEVKQSLLGRILGYADIYFSGTGTSKVVFSGVEKPWKLKSEFEDVIGD